MMERGENSVQLSGKFDLWEKTSFSEGVKINLQTAQGRGKTELAPANSVSASPSKWRWIAPNSYAE